LGSKNDENTAKGGQSLHRTQENVSVERNSLLEQNSTSSINSKSLNKESKMSPVQWSRLVRYIDTNGNTGYGEPQVSSDTDVLQEARDGKLQVKVLEGDSALTATPTDEIQTVRTLLSPLTQQEVPIVRCIGLNYKTHSITHQLIQEGISSLTLLASP
jgi:hypothetical protein